MDVAPDGRVWTAIRNPETIVTSRTRAGADVVDLGMQGPPAYRSIRITADGLGVAGPRGRRDLSVVAAARRSARASSRQPGAREQRLR